MSEPSVDDLTTFADVKFGNLTETEARLVVDNTPATARAHPSHGLMAGYFLVLVEDLTLSEARDLFALVADRRAKATLDFPDVPNWRDIRTGTDKAWQEFADAHLIHYPAGASRQRIRGAVRSWLEKNR